MDLQFEYDDVRRGEMYLRLAEPHSHIIITPPRAGDGKTIMTYMNDMNISQWLAGPPYPYTTEDLDKFYTNIRRGCDEARKQIEEFREGKREWLDGLPVRSIRDIRLKGEDGFSLVIGDIDLHRASFVHLLDREERKRVKLENDEFPSGDKDIKWEFGDFLATSHQGRGIMSAAVKAIIEISVKYLNVHHIQAQFFSENIASRRTFEKNGFLDGGIVPKALQKQESKGGEIVDLGLVLWHRTTS